MTKANRAKAQWECKTESLFRWFVRRTEAGCWEWAGRLTSDGYGVVERKWKGRLYVRAHRLAYAVLVGPIPGGLTIEHKCRNRKCVNPDHLVPMTHQRNLQERDRARRRDERQRELFVEA